MIQRLKEGSELMIKLDIDTAIVADIKATYYTNIDNKIIKTMNDVVKVGNSFMIKLESADTANFKGILYSELNISIINEYFPDGTQEVLTNQTLNVIYE